MIFSRLLTALLLLAPPLAFAQGVNPLLKSIEGGTGSTTGGGGGTPGGTSGQVQYNNSGSFGGFTVSGDGTLNTSTGALTISKIGGVALGTAAFQPASAFDAAGAAAAAQAASLPIGATTLPASFVASSLTSAAGGSFGTGAYAAAYVLPAATSSILGGVKPDGTTLTNSSGAISVAYGAAAATAAQGNDSRITGALQSSALGSGVATALGIAKNTSGGVVLLNGAPTSGDLLQWSATGAQDSGVALSNVPLLNAANSFTANQAVSVTSGVGLTVTSTTGAASDTIKALYAGSTGGGAEIITTNGYSATQPIYAFWFNNGTGIGNSALNVGTLIANGAVIAKWSSAGLQATNLLLPGSSTGVDTISSGNVSTTSRTISTPAGTANDTLALLGAGQTFSAANTFSGAVTHSGSALFSGAQATFSANNQTVLMGGSTAPTFNASYAGSLAIGGGYTTPGSMAAVGQAAISVSAGIGLVLQGKSTSGLNEVSIYGGSGNWLGGFGLYGLEFYKLSNPTGNHLIAAYNASTLGTGGGTIGANQNGTYYVSFTAGASQGSQIINLPTANADWTCELHDRTTPGIRVQQTNAASTNSATFTSYSYSTGATANFTTGDLVTGTCWAG